MDVPTILWFVSISLTLGLLGWWFVRTQSQVAKRVSVTLMVFATAFHLLFAHNTMWVGYQSLRANYTYQPAAEEGGEASLLIDFRDVGGNALLLDPATMDVDALIGQLSRRIGEPHADVADASVSLPVDSDAIRATADQLALKVPLEKPIVVDRDTVERRLLEKHILSHTYSRSNPPRNVFSVRLGIDLRGGVEFLCRLYDRQGVAQPATDEEVTILRERLDARGLTEPQISRLSNGDIQVVIPGGTEADAAQTRNLIENTGNLEVREIKAEIQVGTGGRVRFDTNGVNSALDGQFYDSDKVFIRNEFGIYRFAPGYPGPTRELGKDVIVAEKTPFGVEPRRFFHLGPVEIQGEDVDNAAPSLQDGQLGVSITFSTEGGPKNEIFTNRVFNEGPRVNTSGDNVSTGRIAFVIDGKVVSPPIINSPSGRHTLISGRFTREEITNLSDSLKSGALTVTPRVLSERVVGASLGQATITKGAYSMLGALLLVVASMVVVYQLRLGPVAVVSLASCISLIFLILGVFDATLTLPGLAGLVLTVGMAVDANILIFERLREELRDDVDLMTCIDKAYSRAFVTIVDANLTTFIAALILFVIGSGPVQGFGLTLMIGIGTSMFSALYVGRWLTELLMRDRKSAKVPRLIGELRLPYLRMRWAALVFSILLVVGGWATFLRGNVDRHFDIDFTGGNMVQVTLDEAMTNAEVLGELEEAFTADPDGLDMLDPSAIQLQPYFAEFGVGGGASRQWSFRARDPQAREIEGRKSAIERELIDGRREIDLMVAAERPAAEIAAASRALHSIEDRVDAVDEELEARQAVFKQQLKTAFGEHVDDEGSEVIAAAWNANELSLELATLTAVSDLAVLEIDRNLEAYPELNSIAVATGNGERTSLVLTASYTEAPDADADLTAPADAVGSRLVAQFRAAGATDLEANVQAAIAYRFMEHAIEAMAAQDVEVDRPFPSTQHFSAQVGDQMRVAATVALGVALLAILLYVAARFEFVYGLGAIIALAHDVLITVGLLAVAGLRIDLTVVAALLTIIGYSLNDTIVVFDRIREVLKTTSLGLRQAIDVAIAQTMSRTILTSLTTLTVVLIVFLFGGDGVHAFAGTLLIGLVLGTYSSVFVAAPILIFLARGKDTLPTGPDASDDDEAGDDDTAPAAITDGTRTPDGSPVTA